jgi:predicted O-methyltransferase YrrM
MDRVRRVINEIKEYGINNDVPIMSEESINTISSIIKENSIKTILEIGTAIGYSTICFASLNLDKITSIERDKVRYEIAVSNVKKSNLNNIELIFDDALNTNINGIYDMVIIDAAKSQNKRFLDKFKNNLKKDGIVIIDNLDFHGFVGKSGEIKSRNLRQMVRKIEKFIDYLDNQNEFDVEYIEVGDKLGVCRRKKSF